VCLQSVFEIALGSLRAQYRLKPNAALATDRFSIIGMETRRTGTQLLQRRGCDFHLRREGILTATLTNHQFFTKLAEEIVRAVAASSAEGNIFRIVSDCDRGEIWSAGAVAG